MSFFQVTHRDKTSQARVGILKIRGIEIPTPVFMPVGTQATVKTVAPWELEEIGYQIILANTYHLYLRPGPEFFKLYPDLHKLMRWKGALLTDSGGYQVFSLAKLRKITSNGVWFSSHIDGKKMFFSPEEVIKFQLLLNSDIMMPLDECLEYPVSKRKAKQSLSLTNIWAERSLVYWEKQRCSDNLLFGIVQGAYYSDLREEAARQLASMSFPGYAIGGLSVGEPQALRWQMTEICTSILPENKPRYLMGVGAPQDIVKAVALGVDMFDCVIPTRYARTGIAFTWKGKLNLRNSRFKEDISPIDPNCSCPACRRGLSRAYIRHLISAKEILGARLLTLHNLHFYFELMDKIRKAIIASEFAKFMQEFVSK